MLTKAHIKFIQELLKKKTVRDENALFVAEGPKVVAELLQSENVQADEVYATDIWLAEHHQLAYQNSRFVMEVSDQELDRISGLATPNQVLAVFHKPRFHGQPDYRGKISLMLDGIQDPGNLGTIIRTADWFGVENIICSPACADAFNPKVVQSTMGSLTRVNIACEDLADFASHQKTIPLYAATLAGTNLPDVNVPTQAFLVIGNESRGISHDLLALATHKITIPRYGHAESLNAAVATGVVLSHLMH